MFQLLIHRVVHSVINPVEQTQGTDLASMPRATKFTLTQPFRAASNTIQQAQISH